MANEKIIETSEKWPSVRSVHLKFNPTMFDLKSIVQTVDESGNWRAPKIYNGLVGDDLATQEKEYRLLGHALKIARKWALDTGKPHITPTDTEA